MTGNPFMLREPCARCGSSTGKLTEKGSQDVVYCSNGHYCYCAPRAETGKPVRNVKTRGALPPKVRARVIERATGRCEMCGKRPDSMAELHVAHLLSVQDGKEGGLSEEDVNSLENLAAMCDECNLGLGKRTVPLRLAVAMVMARCKPEDAK